MSKEIFHIKSISHLHELIGLGKPTHPLISIVDVSQLEAKENQVGMTITSSLYAIGLKDKSCGWQYGRKPYDFDEGVMYFTAPYQAQTVGQAHKKNEIKGWIINFHPDLIRNMPLGKIIDKYNFFSYNVHEALHLSDTEQETITDCTNFIKKEISARIDNHSQIVISSSLELLLNLAQRYYERQFNTRSAKNSDIVSQFKFLLKEYDEKGHLSEYGIPSIEYFSKKVNLSPNYLSDLLKKETGHSAKEHINNFIIEKAKTYLINSKDSISEIAYTLGFNYPHYFSRIFKNKTGMTPQEYRKMN